MAPARIRPARVADAAAISRLRVETWKSAYAGIVDPQVLADLVSDEASIERQRGYIGNPGPRTHTFVATIGEGLVGWAVAAPTRDDDAEKTTGEIYALYVDAAHWGTGLGRRLMATALGALRKEGFRRVTLWVLEGNARARRFYEAAGLVPDGARQLLEMGTPVPEVRYAGPL
ncbi:MAG: GNAT family N-acetyltransferase [Mycobacteriales bacterium]